MFTPTATTARVLVFARTWAPDALDSTTAGELRERIRGLGAELLVIGASGAWAFGPEDDTFGEYRDQISADLATTARLLAAPGDTVFVVDGAKVLRVAHAANDLVEAVDAAAKVLVMRRLSTNTVPRIPLASLHRWVAEHAS